MTVPSASALTAPPDASRRARGRIRVEQVDGASALVGICAGTPLKLLPTRPRGSAAWVHVTSFGGGLLPGDDLRLRLRVGREASLFVGSPAATKIFRSDGRPSRSRMHARIATGGLLVWAPDPAAPFAGSIFSARQRIDLDSGASLAFVDLLAAGRPARGECWAATRLSSRTVVLQDGLPLVSEALALDPTTGGSLARWGCLGTAILVGPRVAGLAQALLNEWSRPPDSRAVLITTASPLTGGVLLRCVGPAVESVATVLHGALARLAAVLGGDPWAHRF